MKIEMLTDNTGKSSSGRIMVVTLFIVSIGMWLYIKAMGLDMTDQDVELIKYGVGFAIIGKGLHKMAENK